MNDDGRTYDTNRRNVMPTQNNQQRAQASIQDANQQIQNAKFGVLANRQTRDAFTQQQSQGNELNRGRAGAISALQSVPIVAKTIGKGFWETGDLVKATAQRDQANFRQSLDQSIIGGVGRFGQSVASTALTPYSNKLADRERERANKLLKPAYEKLYGAYGSDPRLGKIQAQVEAGQADYNLRTDPLNRSRIGVNDSTGTTIRKVGAQAAEAGLDILTAPAMALASQKALAKATGKEAIKQAERAFVKSTLNSGVIGAGGNVANALQQDSITKADLIKAAGVGLATGVALPVAIRGGKNFLDSAAQARLSSPRVQLDQEIQILRDLKANEMRAKGGAKETMRGMVLEQQAKVGALKQEIAQSGSAPAEAFDPLDVSGKVKKTDPLESLKQEARKYKSAEEFVNAQANAFHGTSKNISGALKPGSRGSYGRGIYFEHSKQPAYKYGDRVMRSKVELKNPYKPEENLDEWFSKYASGDTAKKLQAAGYDGVETSAEKVAFNSNNVLHEGQLTDLYNQATQSQPPKSPLTEHKGIIDPLNPKQRARMNELADKTNKEANPNYLEDYRKERADLAAQDARWSKQKDMTAEESARLDMESPLANDAPQGKTDINSKMLAEAKKRGYGDKYSEEGQVANTIDELMKEINAVRDVGVPLLDKYKPKMDGKTSIEKLMTPAERKAYKQAQQTSDNASNLLKEYFDSKKAAPAPQVGKTEIPKEYSPELPSRSQSPLRASMTEDEFFQKFNPDLNASRALSQTSDVPDVRASSQSTRPTIPSLGTEQKAPRIAIEQPVIKSGTDQSLPNNTPKDNPVVQKYVKDYAKSLRQMEDGMTGGQMIPDGKGGYKRYSEHSDFYRNYFEANGRKPTNAAWLEEAQRQLETGKGDTFAVGEYQKLVKDASDPEIQALVNQVPEAPLTNLERNKLSAKALRKEVLDFRDSLTPVKKTGGEANIPVRKMTQDGDIVTATNVNPNIKAKEKRFSLDDEGNLKEDRTGAYSIFSNEDGEVEGFRIGKEYFNAKELGDLSDVNDYGSTLATMRRNVERGFGEKTGKKVNEFLVDHQQAQATKMIERHLSFKQGMQSMANDLGISFGVGRGKAKKVSAAIQDFGEGARDKASLVDEFGKDQAQKIVQADGWFKNQYNTLLDEMNSTLTQYGYAPVPKRKNYYTHFQDETLWKSFGLKMQEIRNLASPTLQDASPTPTRGKISNALAGESEFTKPNKRFNPFALQRKGDTHTSDAFQAFERYLNPTLNNIYMTPSITRARVLAKAVAQDADIRGKDANKVLIQVKEWANDLAGKSNRFDRPLIDSKGGQIYLKSARWAQKKAGQNTIVGNLSTAVMQPIVVANTAGKFGYKNTILGALQEMSTAHTKNAAIRQSEFMRRRYTDLSPVTASKTDRAKSVANKPLEIVEETAARITWNAAHNDAISKGLKGQKAIQYADVEAEKTLSGRSIGEKPEAFRSKAAAPLTMYQLEVNNYWQQLGKEMTKAQAAKTMVAAYGLNLLLQEITGRQVGFNPIDAAIDSYQETQKEDKGTLDKTKAIGQRFAGEVVDNVPFVAPIATATFGDRRVQSVLGKDSSVGRFGNSSPISALTSTTNIHGIPVPQNLILPFGGSQFKKTVEGVGATKTGSANDKNGDKKVNIPQNFESYIKGALFGKNAIPEVNAYNQNLGKKKVDQIPVPNQTNSTAASMGINNSTKDDPVKDSMRSPEAKKFLALSAEEQKLLAATDPNARALYENKKNIEKAFSSPELFPEGLSEESKKILTTRSRLSDQAGKRSDSRLETKLAYEKAKFERDDLEGKLDDENRLKRELYHSKMQYALENGVKDTSKVDELFEVPKHKFALKSKEWQDNIKNKSGYKDSVDDYKDQEALVKMKVESPYSKEAVNLYSMSEKRIQSYIDGKGGVSKALWDELVKLDSDMVAQGLQKYSKLDGASGKGGSGKKKALAALKTVIDTAGGDNSTPKISLAVRKPNAPSFRKPRKAIPKPSKTPTKLVVRKTK
jgi:hypothetical protein